VNPIFAGANAQMLCLAAALSLGLLALVIVAGLDAESNGGE
jgi:hypothetical protein